MNRAELLEKIDSARAELNALLAQIPEESMLAPALPNGWTVKDLLAHLEAWALRAEYLYYTLAAGKPVEDEIHDADVFNAIVYKANLERTLAYIRPAEEEAFRRLRAVAETAPEEHLFEPGCFAWTQGRAFMDWIAWNTYDHYAEHLPDLQAWVQAGGPALHAGVNA